MDNAAAGWKKWIDRLLNLWNRNKKENTTHSGNQPYHSLSPIDDADPDGHYSDALLWALQCNPEQDIKNIALTGPYGSGKSSILRTFEKKHSDKGFKFLRISLATFKDPTLEPKVDDLAGVENQSDQSGSNKICGVDSTQSESDILHLIEYSILQQIFYHEDPRKLPDSRIKRTKSYKRIWMWALAFFLFSYFTSIFYVLNPKWIQNIICPKFTNAGTSDSQTPCNFGWLEHYIYFTALSILIIGTIYILYAAIRPLRSIRINKFSIQDVEFSLNSKIDRSILNKHLDEILYFFEVAPYNVVIIEDLDRFGQTEIFTKLRELNHLINYSKTIKKKKKVVFIYAVREDMFHSKDRIKFFDFIIPVIPIVDASNSDEMLEKIVSSLHPELDKNFLSDISMFIDDMRLLHNIMNEYLLYSKNLKGKLNLQPNQLLAIVLYKNLYPTDFLDLSNSKGVLYDIFATKEEKTSLQITDLLSRVQELESQIERLKIVPIKEIKELRKLYLLEYLLEYPMANKFIINDREYDFEEVLEDDLFENIINNSFGYIAMEEQDTYERAVKILFDQISRRVDNRYTYNDRFTMIKEASAENLQSLKNRIKAKNRQISVLRYQQIKEQLRENDDQFEVKTKDQKQSQLIRILLRNGYIDESYSNYVSLFHEGALTRADKEFVLNVKAHVRTQPDYKLVELANVVSKLPAFEFEKEYVLNFKLVDYLITLNGENEKLDRVMQLLANEKESSIYFLNKYIFHCADIEVFFQKLAKYWSNIWKFIENNKDISFDNDLKNHYFLLILKYTDINDLLYIGLNSSLAEYCSERSDFLTLVKDNSRTKKLISTLNIKFKDVDVKSSATELLEYVYENSYYIINSKMLATWCKYKGVYTLEEFEKSNYSALLANEESLKKMIEYIDANMNQYIEQVWFELQNHRDEPSSVLPIVLNNTTVNNDSKKQFLRSVKSNVYSILEINEIETIQMILDEKKMGVSWENSVWYYGKLGRKFDDTLLAFLDDTEVSSILCGKAFMSSMDYRFLELWEPFAIDLITQAAIDDSNYRKLLQPIVLMPNVKFKYTGLEESKVTILIEVGLIKMTPWIFSDLRLLYSDLHIKLVEVNNSEYLANHQSYQFHFDEIHKVLRSERLSTEIKNLVIKSLDQNVLKYNSELQKNIIEHLIKGKKNNKSRWPINKEVLIAIITNRELSLALRREVLTLQIQEFSKIEFIDMMKYWDEPYNLIGTNIDKVTFDKDSIKKDFAILIQGMGFVRSVSYDEDNIYLYNY